MQNIETSVQRIQQWKCKDIQEEFDYENKKILGAGTYGKVYKAQCKADQQIYALKCIKMIHEKEGFPVTSLREIKFLTTLEHQNVIKIIHLYTRSKRNKQGIRQIKTYCAMDLMPFDFFKIMKQNSEQKRFFTSNQVRSILFQCFSGLQYIHQHQIIHRDIKGANILVNKEGIVKLADFGLAKYCPKYEFVRKTPLVVTLSYRAPEVLLTRGNYDFQLDVWSMGVFALEISLNQAVFRAKDEADQIEKIIELCGTPTEETWPEILQSEYFQKMKPRQYQRKIIAFIRNQRMDFDDQLLDLIDKIMVMNPQIRLNVDDVLKHDYFRKHDMNKCLQELQGFMSSINQKEKVAEDVVENKKDTGFIKLVL